MNYIKTYENIGIHSENEVFEYLISNFKDTIRIYDFLLHGTRYYLK